LATCFGSSERSSGQFLIYRHGSFLSHHVCTLAIGGSLEPKHVANYVLMILYIYIYIYVVFV